MPHFRRIGSVCSWNPAVTLNYCKKYRALLPNRFQISVVSDTAWLSGPSDTQHGQQRARLGWPPRPKITSDVSSYSISTGADDRPPLHPPDHHCKHQVDSLARPEPHLLYYYVLTYHDARTLRPINRTAFVCARACSWTSGGAWRESGRTRSSRCWRTPVSSRLTIHDFTTLCSRLRRRNGSAD